MKMRALAVGLSIAAVSLAVLPTAQARVPAAAPSAGSVTVTSTGPGAIKTYTYKESRDAYAVFTVNDPAKEGSLASQCWLDSAGDVYDCDTYVLEEMAFPDGEWRIRPTADGWEIRVFVGYGEVSAEDCVDQFRGDVGVDLAILGEDDAILAEKSQKYEVLCQGYAAFTKGDDVVTAHVGRESSKLAVEVTGIDAEHDAKSARGCVVGPNGRAADCERIDLRAGETDRGWKSSRDFSLGGVSDRKCKSLKRSEPVYTYEVEYLNRRGDVMYTAEHEFTVTCR